MTAARSETVLQGKEGMYHCTARCVRRAFLCGTDGYTGRNYEHRKQWIERRLQGLSEGAFAMDVFGYAIMSNHLHIVLRNRPDVVALWLDEEVARRWLLVFPKRWTPDGMPEEPKATEIKQVLEDPDRVAVLRDRLSDLSWFMRAINEYVARRANREDACKGHFWEGRFRCKRLLDRAALLTCLTYVDLNPVRAGLAESLEDSAFTSAHTHVEAQQAREKVLRAEERRTQAGSGWTARQEGLLEKAREQSRVDGWLSGFPTGSALDDTPEAGGLPGELGLTLREYLDLTDWTGRELRADKPGAIPPHVERILKRMDIQAAHWVAVVERYDSRFRRMVGRAQAMVDAAKEIGARFLKGVATSRLAFGMVRQGG